MTLIYDVKSWHYNLILYVYGKNFFTEVTGIDIQSMEAVDMEKDFIIKYKRKNRTVNFCPYWRAVIGAIVFYPFIVLWRIFPHEKKERTHQEIIARSKRNTKIVRTVVAVGMGIMGVWKLIDGDYLFACFYFGLSLFNLYSVPFLKWVAKNWPHVKFRTRVTKPKKEPRPTPKVIKKLQEFHENTCPPIIFVDVKSEEELI